MMGPFFFYEFFSPKQSVDSRQISSKIKASKTEECTSKTRGSHLLVDQRSRKESYYERAKSMFSPPCGQSHFERVISSSSSSSLSSSQITSTGNYHHQHNTKNALQKRKAPMKLFAHANNCLLYTSPSPRDVEESRMPSSA